MNLSKSQRAVTSLSPRSTEIDCFGRTGFVFCCLRIDAGVSPNLRFLAFGILLVVENFSSSSRSEGTSGLLTVLSDAFSVSAMLPDKLLLGGASSPSESSLDSVNRLRLFPGGVIWVLVPSEVVGGSFRSGDFGSGGSWSSSMVFLMCFSIFLISAEQKSKTKSHNESTVMKIKHSYQPLSCSTNTVLSKGDMLPSKSSARLGWSITL